MLNFVPILVPNFVPNFVPDFVATVVLVAGVNVGRSRCQFA